MGVNPKDEPSEAATPFAQASGISGSSVGPGFRPPMAGKHRNVPVRVVVGAVLLALAVIGSALLFMQPWVSCTVDDVSAGCPVPEDLVTITSIGWAAVALAAVTGIVLLARMASREVV